MSHHREYLIDRNYKRKIEILELKSTITEMKNWQQKESANLKAGN